jgi:hypothetical protein
MKSLNQIYNLVLESILESKEFKLPYIDSLLSHINIKSKDGKSIKVMIVDGDWIRTNIDEEWTNFGQHFRFKYVPEDEFWISKEIPQDEYKFYITHLIKEYSLMAHGKSYSDAITKADKIEHKERSKEDDLPTVLDPKTGRINYCKFHKELIKTLDNGLKVWKVDGKLVRDILDTEWVSGGHNCVYFFVPKNEIWIDNKVDDADIPYVLLHELHEHNLMKKGMAYSKAHADSSKIELYARKHITEVETLLQNEGY